MRPINLIVVGAALLLGAISATAAERPSAATARAQAASAAAADPLGKIHRLPPSLEQKVQAFRTALECGKYGN